MCKRALLKKIKYDAVLLLFVLPFISFATVSQIFADNLRDYFKPDNFQYVYATNRPIPLAATGLDKSAARILLTSLPSQSINASQALTNSASSLHEADGEKENRELPHSQDMAKDIVPPVVRTDLKSAVVNDANLFFSGEAHDDCGIAQLFVNKYPLEIRPGKHVFFNHLLILNEGENTITVKAVDAEGNETQLLPVKITKKTFDLLETDARYTVALLPLKTSAKQSIPSETIYSALLKAFDEEPRRFNFVERDTAKLQEILHEQKISNTELMSPDVAIKIGKIRAAEGIFFGAVKEDAKGINITLRLVDTETTRVLAIASVYDEDKSIKNLEWLIYGLSLKMKRQFPIVQGNVIGVSRNGFFINAGATNGIGAGMKLLLFREVKEGDFIVREPLDAVARVVRVRSEVSFAKISRKGTSKVKKRDLVITK